MNDRHGNRVAVPSFKHFLPELFILAFSLLAWNAPGLAAEPDQLEALNRLSPYFDGQKSPNDLAVSEQDSCPVKLTKLAALYRFRPDQYRNAFFEMLVIDDYAARDNGNYHFVAGDQVGAIVGESIRDFGKPDDKRFALGVAYCALRDKNLWLDSTDRGRLSLARFMRSAFLAAILKNTDEDPLAIVNAIDRRTAQQYEQNKNTK